MGGDCVWLEVSTGVTGVRCSWIVVVYGGVDWVSTVGTGVGVVKEICMWEDGVAVEGLSTW